MTVGEMFATKLVVSSLGSAMQTTPEGSHVIHHAIDSCGIRNSNPHPEGSSDGSVGVQRVPR